MDGINLSWNASAAGLPPDSNLTAESEINCFLTSRFYIYGILSGVLCITGIVTNGFSIAVLSRDRDTSQVLSLLLRSLACADIFFLSTWIIVWTLPSAFSYRAAMTPYHFVHLRIYSFQLIFIGQTATIWTTVLIAATQFIVVSFPYHALTFCTLRRTRIRLAAVAVFSFAYNIPRFFENRVLPVARPGKPLWERTEFGLSYGYSFVYLDICYYIFSFFLPLVLLTTFNLRLIVNYRRFNRKQTALLTSGRTSGREKHEQNINLVMIIVIVVFVMCNMPAKIIQYVTLSYSRQPCPSTMFFLIQFSNILELFNSNLNFFVYFIFRKQFRKILQRELCATSARRTATLTQQQLSIEAPTVAIAAPNGHAQLNDSCNKNIAAKDGRGKVVQSIW